MSRAKESRIADCTLLSLNKINNRAGNITVVQNNIDLSFAARRIYYLYDIPGGEERGAHAHKELYQLIIAASGSFDITVFDGFDEKTIHLNRPYFGLYIVPGIWRNLSNFSSGAICLVLASEMYNAAEYIRTYDEFLHLKRG